MIFGFIIFALLRVPLIQAPSVEDLRHELSEWIRIGIGDDIIRMPNNRQEYAPLVAKVEILFKQWDLDNQQKVNRVLGLIEMECRVPRLKRILRPYFWHLVKVYTVKSLRR